MVTLRCLVLQNLMGQATSFQPASWAQSSAPRVSYDGTAQPYGVLGSTPEGQCLQAALWVCEHSTSWDPHTVTHGFIPLLPELRQPLPLLEFSS